MADHQKWKKKPWAPVHHITRLQCHPSLVQEDLKNCLADDTDPGQVANLHEQQMSEINEKMNCSLIVRIVFELHEWCRKSGVENNGDTKFSRRRCRHSHPKMGGHHLYQAPPKPLQLVMSSPLQNQMLILAATVRSILSQEEPSLSLVKVHGILVNFDI